jgi:hypothetical protein
MLPVIMALHCGPCNGGSPNTDAMALSGWPVANAVTADSRTGALHGDEPAVTDDSAMTPEANPARGVFTRLKRYFNE